MMKVVPRKHNVQIPAEFFDDFLPKLTLNQIRVYLLLVSVESENGMDTISLKLKLSKSEIFGIIHELSELGLIEKDTDGSITIMEHPCANDITARSLRSETLLFDVEQIKGCILSSNEVSLIFYLKDVLSFSDQLISYLCSYCKDKGKFSEPYIRTVALSWHEKGISTPEEAAACLYEHSELSSDVFKHLGRNSVPTDTEKAYINRWRDELCLPEDVILYACDITAINTDKNRLPYASKILEHYSKMGVKTLDDAVRLSAIQKKERMSSNPFNNFEQNKIDFEALEKLLLDN